MRRLYKMEMAAETYEDAYIEMTEEETEKAKNEVADTQNKPNQGKVKTPN